MCPEHNGCAIIYTYFPPRAPFLELSFLCPGDQVEVGANSGTVGRSLAEILLGYGGAWPVETPNLGGRRETLRDVTRIAENAEATIKIRKSSITVHGYAGQTTLQMQLFPAASPCWVVLDLRAFPMVCMSSKTVQTRPSRESPACISSTPVSWGRIFRGQAREESGDGGVSSRWPRETSTERGTRPDPSRMLRATFPSER